MIEVITVKEVVYPSGKGPGKVIDTNGGSWQVWPDKLIGYTVGRVYQLTDVETGEYRGAPQYTIKAAKPIAALNAAPLPMASAKTPIPQPAMQHTMDHERRMDIFVCGAMNAILSNPTVDPSKLTVDHYTALVNRLRVTWTRTLGPTAPKIPPARGESDTEMNDEIGF